MFGLRSPQRNERRDAVKEMREFVKSRRREELGKFGDYHLFPDCIVRLPSASTATIGGLIDTTSDWPEHYPLQGAHAEIDTTGGIAARATLARSLVPGMHGWQKEIDTRELAIVVSHPEYDLVIDAASSNQLDIKLARRFAATINQAAKALEYFNGGLPASASASTSTSGSTGRHASAY